MTDLGARFEIADPSGIGEARRSARSLGAHLGLQDSDIARVAICVTEAATNILRHAGRGELVLAPVLHEAVPALAVLALDKGPGIPDLARCFQDGYSTMASSGDGMGALRRQSDEIDVFAPEGAGTALLTVFRKRTQSAVAEVPAGAPFHVAALRLAFPGARVCGDEWAIEAGPDCLIGMVVDGLGHGKGAAEAAQEMVRVFRAEATCEPADLLWAANEALRRTRGAAAATFRIEASVGRLRFAAVGNVSGMVISGSTHQSLLGHGGIVGTETRRCRPQDFTWTSGSVLVLHSDGITPRWRPEAYPGLLERHPLLCAGVLLRDHQRHKDDVCILVATGSTT